VAQDGAVVILTAGAATAVPRGGGFHGGGFQRGFDPRFDRGMMDHRFNHGMFDPRFNRGMFDPRFRP
jgi:hypothetical protein